MEITEENSKKIGKKQKKSKLNSEKIWFHNLTCLSSIFPISFHYSTDFSSILCISYHYSTCLSSIFFISFHYLT
jgi:hypothetical protein